jgi:hypothetical protein
MSLSGGARGGLSPPEKISKATDTSLVAASETGWDGLSPPERKFLGPPLMSLSKKYYPNSSFSIFLTQFFFFSFY